MGLIYVNPEGPNASGDYMAAAKDIRATFGRMAMNDEETVALIAGGHTFGKAHGAAPESHKGPEPEGAPLEAQGLGWTSNYGKGHGEDTISSGLEVTWTKTPALWSNNFFENLFKFEWELTKSPAGAKQWVAKNAPEIIPDAHVPGEEAQADDADHRPDAALRPGVRQDLAPLPRRPAGLRRSLRARLVQADAPRHGPEGALPGPGSAEGRPDLAGPAAEGDAPAASAADIADLKAKIAASGLSVAQLVSTAWASASTFRGGDKRGGANGARIRLAPQKDWEVNNPAELAKVLAKLEEIQKASGKVSLADLIVLAGGVGVEQAAKKAGVASTVPFAPGRVDATQEQTDVESFAVLEPLADGFRNYQQGQVDAYRPRRCWSTRRSC